LKQEKIHYNPFLIRTALENTAHKSSDEFSVGRGLIQIHKALEYMRSLSGASLLSNIHLEMVGGQGRGIYLRDFDQVQNSSGDIRLTVKVKHTVKDASQTSLLQGESRRTCLVVVVTLTCDSCVQRRSRDED
jgi:hypothetical protein